jgi:uncharacterized protein (UPF0333 family)
MKAQAAFEYMLIVIIVLAFLIPLWSYMITVNSEASDELVLSYAKNTVDSITSTSDLVYSQGPPAKVRVSVFIPSGIQQTNITNKTVTLTVVHSSGTTGIFSQSRARLNGTIPDSKGSYWLEIRAVDHVDYEVDIQAV